MNWMTEHIDAGLMTCWCRLLDGEWDRCVSGEHVVGGHTYRTLLAARVTLASTVSSVADPLRTRREARQRSSRTDATRWAISRTASCRQRVTLSAGSRQGISVYLEVVAVVRRSRAAALSRQDERSDSSQDRRPSAAPTARLLPALQRPILPPCRRRLRLVVVLLPASSLRRSFGKASFSCQTLDYTDQTTCSRSAAQWPPSLWLMAIDGLSQHSVLAYSSHRVSAKNTPVRLHSKIYY